MSADARREMMEAARDLLDEARTDVAFLRSRSWRRRSDRLGAVLDAFDAAYEDLADLREIIERPLLVGYSRRLGVNESEIKRSWRDALARLRRQP